ncbi:MAG TPA: hypothetical protein VHG28_25205 [Longimicrobiaceae bacterium]|nr:hypothetical protein [Longimicrobiaceae bacterium]
MTTQTRRRSLLLKGVLAAFVLALGLLASPRLVPDAYADAAGCTATCSGGSCSADPGEGQTCTCSCYPFTGLPRCSCTKLRESTDG